MYFIIFFFFNDTATTEIYTLSLHDALPICGLAHEVQRRIPVEVPVHGRRLGVGRALRKQLEAEPVAGVVRVEQVARIGQQLAAVVGPPLRGERSEEHTSELQSPCNLVCRLPLVKKKKIRSID